MINNLDYFYLFGGKENAFLIQKKYFPSSEDLKNLSIIPKWQTKLWQQLREATNIK